MDSLFLKYFDYKKLPEKSGVYRFYNKNKDLIYIGKAKNLKSRVSSYFINNNKSIKTYNMVKNIEYINFTVVNNEHEAFLLENNLIKQFKPRYNILLKDNKTYPYLIITNEEYPKIIPTETIPEDYMYIFGPFSNRTLMHELLEFIRKTCKIRNCKYNINSEDIKKNKYTLCLEYHIENCSGICKHLISKKEYDESINKAIDILNGNLSGIKKNLKKKMLECSKKELFKLAQKYKTELEYISNYEAKSVISNTNFKDCDVFYIEEDDKIIYCNYLIIRGGLIIFTKNDIFENIKPSDVFILYKDQYESKSKNIISNIKLELENYIFSIPKIGWKKELLEISKKNIYAFKHDLKINKTMEINKDQVLINIKNTLNLKKIPYHIECFDNSNLQGTNPVSSCVVFKNGEPSKEDYRKFIVKTVVGPDDFATMKEVIYRRYCNMKEEDLPDLIIIDGGKGQLNSAVEILKKLNIFDKLEVVGLAKEFEEIYFPNKFSPIRFKENSKELHLIQYIRDESHRFAITFHRKRRLKNFIEN